MIRAGESPRSNSGAATAIARARYENFIKSGNLTGFKFGTELNRNGMFINAALFALALGVQFLHA
jgi:hypothetical protein